MNRIKEFEKIIGYEFKDRSLLETALTHSSFKNETAGGLVKDNERLEFLGDAVLELVSSDFLFHKYPDRPEGELTKLRASLVCEPSLADVANELGLGRYIRLSKGEDASGGRMRKSILSDALEAVIGAMYLDGGMETSTAFVKKNILNDIEHKHLFYDGKTVLQEYLQAREKNVRYELVSESGPPHKKMYMVAAYVGDEKVGEGAGGTKKSAEQQAAYRALLYYNVAGKTGK